MSRGILEKKYQNNLFRKSIIFLLLHIFFFKLTQVFLTCSEVTSFTYLKDFYIVLILMQRKYHGILAMHVLFNVYTKFKELTSKILQKIWSGTHTTFSYLALH